MKSTPTVSLNLPNFCRAYAKVVLLKNLKPGQFFHFVNDDSIEDNKVYIDSIEDAVKYKFAGLVLGKFDKQIRVHRISFDTVDEEDHFGVYTGDSTAFSGEERVIVLKLDTLKLSVTIES